MKTGIELIAEERATHPERGYDATHDAQHTDGAIADMAAIYAVTNRDDKQGPNSIRKIIWGNYPYGKRDYRLDWFTEQPDRVTELIKAGALIAAEIDRIRLAEISKSNLEESRVQQLEAQLKQASKIIKNLNTSIDNYWNSSTRSDGLIRVINRHQDAAHEYLSTIETK